MLTRIVVAVTILWGFAITSPVHAGRWEFQAGVGYDFLSQEFFLDSLQQVGIDSVLVNWNFRRDYLDDLKGQLSVRYRSSDFRTLESRWQYEQTDELIRQKANLRWQPRAGAVRFDLRQEFEHRLRYRGDDKPGDQYLSGFTRIRARSPVGDRFGLFGQTDLDFVDFGGPLPISADYQRIQLRAGSTFQTVRLMLELAGFGGGRRAPDSARLEYWSMGCDASAIGSIFTTEHTYLLRVERRDYNRGENEDDYTRLDFSGRTEGSIRGHLFWRVETDLEAVWFASGDQINASYERLQVVPLVGRSWGTFRAGAGPSVDVLFEQADEFGQGEAHREVGGRADLDYVGIGGVLASLQSQLAWRNMVQEGEFQSDFLVQRLSLFGDLPLAGQLRLALFFSAEWEWHEQAEDDMRVYLLSSGLTWRF